MKALQISLVAALVLAVSGCSAEDEAPPPTMSASSSGAICPTGSTLTYEVFAQQFFEDYCTRCHSTENSTPDERHGAPGGYNWDDYDSIALHAAQIDNVAAAGPRRTNTFMPPDEPRPATAEREQLGEWLACEFAPGMP